MAIKIVDVAPVVNKASAVNKLLTDVVNKAGRKQAYDPARRDYFRDYMRKRRAK